MGKLESEKLSQVLSSTIWGECFQSHNAKDVHREKPHYNRKLSSRWGRWLMHSKMNTLAVLCATLCAVTRLHLKDGALHLCTKDSASLASLAERKTQTFFTFCLEDLGPSANFMIRLWCRDCWWGEKHSCGFFLWECTVSPRGGRRAWGRQNMFWLSQCILTCTRRSTIVFFSQLIFPPVIACGG